VLFATRPSSCNDLLEYSTMIEKAVRTQFGIMPEREPVLIGCQSTIEDGALPEPDAVLGKAHQCGVLLLVRPVVVGSGRLSV
jgi:hypothetical protein